MQGLVHKFLGLLIVVALPSVSLLSQAKSESDPPFAPDTSAERMTPPATPPVARAHLLEGPPELDGEILQDPVWQAVEPVQGFWQTRPFEGRRASEETEVRVAYTREALYFGVICYDRRPDLIIVSDSRRDSPLDDTDSFQIILDTYHDQQSGFVFGTNPAGIEYDGQVANEGQGGGRFGRQSGGSGGGFNINWDGAWEVRTQVGDFGWSIEFAIPFRTLRYPSADPQLWGMNFQRNIRRHNEIAYWSPLPRQYNLFRLSLAGDLTGLEIPSQRNLKLIPFVVGEARKRGGSETVRTGDAGFDGKYSLTPSLTLDFTYNTDFAQVEVDEQQINLDRFNLFFPEKRPFFLENAGLFAVGDSGEAELFFSRRIGIGPRGAPVPILGGVRLTGTLGQTNIGFLNMQTEEMSGLAPANNFTVGRVRQELGDRSYIGGMFINRQGVGDLAADQDFNRTFGFDGRWGIGQRGDIEGFFAATSTPGLEDDSYAFKIGARYDSERWLLTADYTEVTEDFNPEVGFLAREGGYRKPSFLVFHRWRPNFGGFHELRPHVSYRGYWTPDGFQQTGFLHVDNHWEWRNGYEVHTGVNFTREGVREDFEIFPGVVIPPNTYDHVEGQLVANTDEGDWLSFAFRTNFGGFFGGDRVNLRPSMKLRIGEAFNTSLSWSRNDISLPGGDFVTNLGVLRVSYSFTPRLFVQTLIQYNDRADVWATNVRLGWLQTSNTGLFIVYNDTRAMDGLVNPAFLPDRSLVIKFNRLFDLLD